MAKKLRKLTVRNLREWLEKQPADARFETRSGQKCPIAQFVDEDHYVFSNYIAMHNPDGRDLSLNDPRRVRLPEWAKRFIALVDSDGGYIDSTRAMEYLAKATSKERIP